MAMDEQPKKKPLSEIGHLFLSSVRDRQHGGNPAPKRKPPAKGKAGNVDLTPEEYAQVIGNTSTASGCTVESGAAASARRTVPVTAIIGEHLNGKQLARVKDYARHLANLGTRIGLIELDASEFRLMCFEPADNEAPQHAPAGAPGAAEPATDCYDPRMMAEAIEELNFDVDRWLLMVPSPRVPEAQPLLKLVDHWVLLSTCDHDGIVSSYRTLKGLSDVHRPRLSLAVLDAIDTAQADKVHKKLAGVCQQFLDRCLEAEPPVRREHKVCEHVVMLCQPNRDKAQLANPPQWGIVADFLMRNSSVAERSAPAPIAEVKPMVKETVAEVVVPTACPEPVVVAEVTVPQVTPAAEKSAETLPEVVDLPSADASAEQIVSAVLKQGGGSAMLECPVRPPMCAEARLAVTRDRSVVLLAVAKRGLAELNAIGQAYRWLIENRSLIGMAVPQLSIDPARAPRLRLLVDQCDAGAEVLQPMLTGEHVAVQSYRRVKWGGKAGLLLEAA
jgi:hypothetical protein